MSNPIAQAQQLLVLLGQSYSDPGEMINFENCFYNNFKIKTLIGGEEDEGGHMSTAQYQKIKFYFDALVEQNYLKELKNNWYQFTLNGYKYLSDLEIDGSKSLLCFVAMSFADTEQAIYNEGIKPAIEYTGYEPFRIDEQHLEREQTINDAMMAAIKKCGFMVADFTRQRANVYFEAGYGLGRGIKVIYTCHTDSFVETHFDTNNYPHIVYKTTQELRQKLIDKIEAWIKI